MLFGATTPSVAASLQICIWYVAAGLVTTAMNSTWFCVGSFEAMFPKDELCPLLAPSQYRRTCDQTSPPPPILHQSVTLYAPASGNVMLVVEKENPLLAGAFSNDTGVQVLAAKLWANWLSSWTYLGSVLATSSFHFASWSVSPGWACSQVHAETTPKDKKSEKPVVSAAFASLFMVLCEEFLKFYAFLMYEQIRIIAFRSKSRTFSKILPLSRNVSDSLTEFKKFHSSFLPFVF